MEYLHQLDQDIFIYLNGLGSSTWDWLWLFITNKWSFIPLYALLIGLVYKGVGLHKTIITLILVALMICLTDQLASFSKAYFERLRPCCDLTIEGRMLKVSGYYGFFSGHAASSMALAIFVGLILRKFFRFALISLILWSLIVGYSRIYVGKHFPGDVLTGWLVGGFIGYLFYKIWQYLIRQNVARTIIAKPIYFFFNK